MKKIFSLVIALMAVMAINATDYYIVGSGSQGWSQNKEENKFVADANGVLTVTVAQLYGEVKVTENGGWHPQWGKTGDANLVLGTPYALTKCDDSQGEADAVNLPVELPEGMRYKNAVLTLDASNPEAIVLTLVSGELYDPNATAPVYCLVGGCTNNWDPAVAIEFVEVNGVLTANVPDLNGTFKIIKNHEWGWELAAPAGTKINGNEPFTLSVGGDNIGFANPFAGYTDAVLTLDMSNAEAPVLTLVSGTFTVFQADWFLPGGKLGWECKDAQKMTKIDDTHYEYLAAEFSGNFKVVYGKNWEVEFGGVKGGDVLNWTVNTPIDLFTPAADVIAADETVYTDVTITITVNYEAATVQILLATEGTAVENVAAEKAVKRIENGQLIIEKNGVRYNALGVTVK